jgi:hypothetical protein
MADTVSGAASQAEDAGSNGRSQASEQENHDALIFAQELNEVYLLIDYVSGRADRALSTLTVPNPNKGQPGEPDMLSSGEVVKRLTAMRYPPDPNTPVANAQNAAILLLAKDALTAMADPARGFTIAYTKLFADAETTSARWGRSLLRRKEATGGAHPAPHARDANHSGRPAAPPHTDSRVTVAARAFPGLQRHAQQFGRWRKHLVVLGVAWLALTVLTYWDAGLARSVLQRLDQNSKSITATEQANPDLINNPQCQSRDAFDKAVPTNKPGEGGGTTDAAKRALACRTLAGLHDDNSSARTDLDNVFRCQVSDIAVLNIVHNIVHVWCWRPLILTGRVAPPPAATVSPPANTDASAALIDWQTAASVLSVFTTYVLPMMFAFLGTVIGAFRSIIKKIRDSELEPRDLMRMNLGIPTGLVAGVAVGLFLSPSSVPSEGAGSVAGELTLTASGLGFLAGYASQSFFTYLDNIVGTVFPNTASATTPSARQPAPAPVLSTAGQLPGG